MITLTCTDAAYHALTEAAHKKRATVKVDRHALMCLIIDHGYLLRSTPHKFAEPPKVTIVGDTHV